MNELQKGLETLFYMARESDPATMAKTIVNTCERHNISLETYIKDFEAIARKGDYEL